MRNTFFVVPLALLALFAAPAAQAQMIEAKDFSIQASAAGRSGPEYLGSDNYKFGFKPEFKVTWQRSLFLSSDEGLGLYLINTPANMPTHTMLGMSVMRDGGRDASDFAELTGTETVQSTIYARLMGEYSFSDFAVGASIRQAFTNDRSDRAASLYTTYKYGLMPNLTGNVTGSVTWASEEYMDRYFGINAAEATASGLPRHDVSDGFRDVTLSTGLSYALYDTGVSVDGRLQWTRLVGDAADSPLTKSADQYSLTVGMAYRYN